MDKTPKNKIRLIPYGMSDFARIRRENKYYVDKTMFIPRLEEFSFQMFLRPRRYGKSLMLNMLAAYYDVAYKDQFDDLFGGLYIGENPMVDKNVSSDYNKMAALIRFEKQFGEKTSIIQRINKTGGI